MRAVIFFTFFLWQCLALAQIGTLAELQGSVDLLRAADRLVAALNDPLYVADVVETGADATVLISLDDGSSLSVAENSRLVLENYHAATPQGLVSLEQGAIWLRVGEVFSRRRNSFRVRTSHAVAGVQGTEFQVRTGVWGSSFTVRSGLVEVFIPLNGLRHQLGPGDSASVTPGGELQVGVAVVPPVDDSSEFSARAAASELAAASGAVICDAGMVNLDRLAEEPLMALFPRNTHAVGAAGLAVSRGNADCTCAEPARLALTAMELGQLLNRNIGDARAVGGLVCREGPDGPQLEPLRVHLEQIDNCAGDAGIDVVVNELIEALGERGERGVLISAIKLGEGCGCSANRHLDRVLQGVDQAVTEAGDRSLGFARITVDLLNAGCRPREEIKNTDERIVDPVSPSQ